MHTPFQSSVRASGLFVAARDGSASEPEPDRSSRWPCLAPLAIWPVVAIALRPSLPAWLFMWAMVLAIFMTCKWITWWQAPTRNRECSWLKVAAYFLAWPGMDSNAFLNTTSRMDQPTGLEWTAALIKTCSGAALLFGVVRSLPVERPLVVGWTGMVGLAFLLHFGVFHLLALWWQSCGIAATPIFYLPALARSVSDLWGSRWNLAFRDLSHSIIYRPLVGHLGAAGASLAVFATSGLIHDLVISVPAAAGYGLPTAYFLIQWLGVMVERSAVGRRLGLKHGFAGWLFALVVVAGPLPLLFHPPFVTGVVIPFLRAIGTI